MKNRLLLLIALLSLVVFGFACGGATNTTNNANANANKPANSAMNTMANTPSNTLSNMPSNTASNTSANKPANTAANKPAKPPKGSTFLCKDGTYSDAKTSQGACSGHGGIDHPVK